MTPLGEGRGSAPAKAILLGEHFVVHGVPALAMPVPTLTVTVTVQFAWAGARGAATPVGDRAAREHVAACLRVCRAHLDGPPPERVDVVVSGNLPVAAGLGSSAALAVATGRAWHAFVGVAPDEARVRAIADDCEALAHGQPSGVDVATVTAAGPLRFRRGSPPEALDLAPGIGLLVLGTDTAGRTAATVAAVAAFRERDPAGWTARADSAAALVADGADALRRGDAAALGAAMDAAHGLLAGLGVSTAALDRAVAAARAAGATGAKLTGGGGGGCAIAACRESDRAAVTRRLGEAGVAVLAGFEIGRKG